MQALQQGRDNCPILCPFATFATTADTCAPARRKVYVMEPQWQKYPFNDLFQHADTKFVKNKPVGPPHSLIREYYATANAKNDLDTLCMLTRKRVQRESSSGRFPRAELVVHLRIGDVVDESVYSLGTMLSEQTCYYTHDLKKCQSPEGWDRYVKPLAAFQSLPDKIAEAPKNIAIMVGSHQSDDLPPLDDFGPRSCWYVHAVQAYLQVLWPSANITIRAGNTPDDDIVMASLARAIVISGGGFTALLGKLCSHCSGGAVYLT